MNENQRKKLAAGSTFERAVLSHSYNSDPYFQKIERGAATVVQPTDPRRIVEALTKKDTKEVAGVGWWQPSKNSLFFEYLGNSSMHGLKYIAQPRRHLSERIFWAVSFLLSCAVAAYFISTVWTRYYDHPVVVAFRPVETDIHSIPFPAVTICNMNRISLDTINRLKVRASKPDNDSFAIQAKKELQFANRICNWEGSFAKMHGYAASRGNLNLTEDSDLFDEEKGRASAELVQFLFAKTNPCEEMIVLCRWGNKRRRCLDLFKPSFTRLGKCCTFNVLPTIFLYSEKIRSRYRRPQNASATPPPSPWTMEELKAWGDWDYSDGVLLNETQKQPYRQRRPGVTQGLTILLNGRTSRYFCSSTDSYGFRVHLHSPLEVSAVQKFGSVVGLGTEVYMEVQPMMTLADPGIRRVSYEKRGCLYPNEIELDYYTPYSTHNCILECTSKSIESNCSCVPFTLPRFPEISVCSSDTHSEEFKCAANVSHAVEDDWGVHCPHCIPLCASLNFKSKITRADLQNATQTWMDHSERLRRPPDWAADNLTILHIYYSRLSFLPSERRELYAITDLIANTGNLLTLCLGFSILSGVEMIYFLTVRVIINRTWRRRAGEKGEEMEKGISTKDPAGAHRESTIQSRIYPLQPSFIPDQEARSTDNNMSQKTNGKAPLYPRTTLHPPPPPPGFIFASNKIPGYTTALQPNNSIVLRRHNNKRN